MKKDTKIDEHNMYDSSHDMQADVEAQHEHQDSASTELEACRAACSEWEQKFLHLSADMQNYKRRMQKDQSLWTSRAQEAVLLPLLAIVDDFDRALAEHEDSQESEQFLAWLEGFQMISRSLYKYLASVKVHPITQMETFDPELHEAIAQVEGQDHEAGAIIDVVQKGFMFGDQVLRPAKVTVAK